MHKYVYENATVYISKVTPEQQENIRKSTERFVKTLMAKGLINRESFRDYRGASVTDSNARKRD